jgi:ATP-dependent Lhr-like helicase
VSAFDLLHPSLQHHIVNSLGWRELRPLQELSIEPVLRGSHCLLLAPTAGGKTESAIFPLLSRMLTENWKDTSILYICPLKALLNNLHTRVEAYLRLFGRTCELWHGDVQQARRGRILKRPPDCLLTTPESIEAMLVSRRVDHRAFFSGVRAIVVDEIHAFAGDDRGWHLLAVLERVTRLSPTEPQRIGLSATVGNPEQLLEWFAGHAPGHREVVSAPASTTGAPLVEIDFVGSLDNAAIVISRLHRGEKRLVFCDSRSKVERLGTALNGLGVRTFLSHSSLSIDERRQTEAAFAASQDCVIVATSTLELGIDVGDLDRVIQIDAPRRVASFLQRIGRTGRRPGSRRNCLFLATSDDALVQGVALVELWRTGFVEPIQPPASPLHLFAQQLMALCLQEGGIGRAAWQPWLLRLPPFREAGKDLVESIIVHLLENAVLQEDQGILHIGRRGEEEYGYRHFSELLSVFTAAPVFTVLHGQREIGVVDQSNFMNRETNDRHLALGGQAWRVLHVDWRGRKAFVEPSVGKATTRWSGGAGDLGFQLARSIQRTLATDTVPQGLSRRGEQALQRIRAEFAWVPIEGSVLRVSGTDATEWWTFGGTKANDVLQIALRQQGCDGCSNSGLKLDLTTSRPNFEMALDRIRKDGVGFSPDHASAEALDALKFGDVLPELIARSIVAKRLFDDQAVAEVLNANTTIASIGNWEADSATRWDSIP